MEREPATEQGIIARNIRECRMRKYPRVGGGKRCAEAFGVSQQLWSIWERGKRTPSASRLEQIAKFFGKTVDFMRRENDFTDFLVSTGASPSPQESIDEQHDPHLPPPFQSFDQHASPITANLSMPELLTIMGRERLKAVYQVEFCVTDMRFVPMDK